MTCRCAGTASGSWSSVMSPPGGAWITTSTACHWKTSSSRTSPGKKDGNTRSASHRGSQATPPQPLLHARQNYRSSIQRLLDPQAGEGVLDSVADVAGQPACGPAGPQGGTPAPLLPQLLADAQALLAQRNGAVEFAGEAANSGQPREGHERERVAKADLGVLGQRVLMPGTRRLQVPGEERRDRLRIGHVRAQVPVVPLLREVCGPGQQRLGLLQVPLLQGEDARPVHGPGRLRRVGPDGQRPVVPAPALGEQPER